MSKPEKTPPKAKPRFRKAKRYGLAFLALFAIATLSFPIWSAWLAKPIASIAGVEIEEIETLSWDRWQLQSITFQQAGIEFEAETLEMPSPSDLIFEYLDSSPGDQSLILRDWSLDVSQSEETSEAAEPGPSIDELIATANDAIKQLAGVLKSVHLEKGIVRIANYDTVAIPELTFSGTQLNAQLEYLPQAIPLSLSANFASPWELQLDAPSHNLTTTLTLESSSDESQLNGSIENFGNAISIEAVWPNRQTGFLPKNALVTTEQFVLDSRYSFWGDAPELRIDTEASWESDSFDFEILGNEPAIKRQNPSIRLAGNGDFDEIRLESAQIDLPWLKLSNENPIRIDPSFETPPSDTDLIAQLILDELPFLETKGTLSGQLRTRSTKDNKPIVAGQLTGQRIGIYDTSINDLSAAFELEASQLTIEKLLLATEQGSTMSGQALIDFATQQVAESQFTMNLKNESALLSELAPGLNWNSVFGELRIKGPFNDFGITANFESKELSLPGSAPFDSTARVTGSASELSARMKAQNASDTLELEIATSSDDTRRELSIRELSLSDSSGQTLLALESPSTLSIQNTDSTSSLPSLVLCGINETKVEIQNLILSSDTLALRSKLANIDPSILQSWLSSPLPDISLQQFSADIKLQETAATLSANGLAHWTLDESNQIDFTWNISASPDERDRLKVDDLAISSDGEPIITAQGQFPVGLSWTDSSLTASLNPDTAIDFNLQSSPRPRFWASISEALPITVKRPVIDASLTGTIDAPKGSLDLAVESLQWSDPEDKSRTITLQGLETRLLANSSNLAIETFKTSVGNNSIQASAGLPLPETEIAAVLADPASLDLQAIEAQLQIELSDLEALRAVLPGILRPSGSAQIQIEIKNQNISARGSLTDLATRPFPPLAPLAKISGDFLYENGVFSTEGLEGVADKSPFTLSGTANLSALDNPLLNLQFVSKGFPLVRDDGLLVSGDIDIGIVSDNAGQTKISGELILTEGLALIEPDLLASSTTTVSTRPPYFAVEAEPFDTWDLDVRIQGEEFLRVSNSYFQGALSAEFALEGNLGTPLLIGKGETSTGRIFFPASSLKLTAGEAFITRDRPSELQIQATASGRLFAYDINLDVQGTADNPELTITSNPALTQVEALLLLTTGAVPNQGGSLAQQSATSLGVFIGKGLFKKLTGGNKDSRGKLELEVGQDISLQGKKTIEATYQLSEKLELEGEYDKRDEYNGNIKWTIFKR